ncbi:MAG: T9SS type A sorting domain-containing protein [Fibrobacter sp.]|nr:T9SS type A sorting domain-containing protein [Fibrobacter sp.]
MINNYTPNTMIRIYTCVLLMFISTHLFADSQKYNYAVVISSSAYSEPGWRAVADSLVKKHAKKGTAKLFTWSSKVTDTKDALSLFKPDYIGYIARPVTECNSAFIVEISRMSRQLDADPYGDAVWGIITGYQASDALRAISESLIVKMVLSASNNLSYEPPIQRFYNGIGMTCDSYTKTDYLFADKQGIIYTENKRPENEQDRIKLVSKWLNSSSLNINVGGQGTISGPVDCIITGGHGNVNLWQCHYPEAGKEGFMQSSGGKLFGLPYSGGTIAINATTPKIYWCASNCLMGNPDKKDNIVYGAFGSGHAVQMFGFVNEASSGDEFMAWGVFDRVTKCAGTYTLAQGFFLSNNNAKFEMLNPSGQMNTTLVGQFMDSTVFYGDPAADVKFYDVGESSKACKSEITYSLNGSDKADFTFTFTMLAHDLEYGAGYCYQFRPISLLPVRIDPKSVNVTVDQGIKAEFTDNLVIWDILSKNSKLAKGKSVKLQWTAKITDNKTNIRFPENYKNKRILTAPSLRIKSVVSSQQIYADKVPSGFYTVTITDLQGSLYYSCDFHSSGQNNQTIRVNEQLPHGIYLISLNGNNLTVQKKVMVK